MDNITVDEAKKLDEIEKSLIKYFNQQIKIEENYEKIQQKAFEPVTSAISKVENKIGEVLNENKNLMGLVPVIKNFADISIPESSYEEDYQLQLPSSTPFRPQRIEPIDRVVEESTIVEPISPNTLGVIIGQIGKKYLPRAKDDKFGLYWNKKKKSFMIGNVPVNFDNNDLIIGRDKYIGTHGLWRLITDKEAIKEELYTEEDLDNYTKILWKTDSIYMNNDPSTKKPKSSKGEKYNILIKPIWKNRNKIEGSGIKKYSENKVEYKYIDDLNELSKRMNYIYAQEKAGNNNFLNEKRAIKDFISNMLDKAIEKPEGIKYLIRILPAINSPIMKEGSGFLNDVINNLPFELHVPGYHYLGPGTKLEKRLKEGDPGINNLDRAARKHDIFYRDHKDTESRNEIADKELQDEALKIVFSNKEPITERLVAIPTAGAMWLKRKFGMGLKDYQWQSEITEYEKF